MTLDELAALPPDALIYLPTGWDVTAWRPGGAVAGGNWYTLLHPPDKNGVIDNRRPVYYDTVQLLDATADEATAWLATVKQLQERIDWIKQHKLTDDGKDIS